jgi:hypothetical protein
MFGVYRSVRGGGDLKVADWLLLREMKSRNVRERRTINKTK